MSELKETDTMAKSDVNAIVIGREEMCNMEHFVILQDQWISDDPNRDYDFIQMDLRPLDGKSEGVGVAISFSTDDMQYEGDYLPITLDKEETKKMLDYLTEVYNAL